MIRRKVPVISCPNWDVEEKQPHKPIILGWEEARWKPYGLYGVVVPRVGKARFVRSRAATFRESLGQMGITHDAYRWFLDQQFGGCACCEKLHRKNRRLIPHHSEGRVWSLLCLECMEDVIHALQKVQGREWDDTLKPEMSLDVYEYLDGPFLEIPAELCSSLLSRKHPERPRLPPRFPLFML